MASAANPKDILQTRRRTAFAPWGSVFGGWASQMRSMDLSDFATDSSADKSPSLVSNSRAMLAR